MERSSDCTCGGPMMGAHPSGHTVDCPARPPETLRRPDDRDPDVVYLERLLETQEATLGKALAALGRIIADPACPKKFRQTAREAYPRA